MWIRLSASRASWLFCCALTLAPIVSGRGDERPPAAPNKLVVQAEFKIVEVSTTKLRNLGFDWAQLAPAGQQGKSIDDVLKSAGTDGFVGFLEALRQNNLARVLAEPTVATLDGRPASFAVGDTRLDIVPIVMGNGRVRLEYRIELASEQKKPALPTRRDMEMKPKTVRLDAAAVLELGKTTLVGRTQTKAQTADGKIQELETLVFVRTDLLKEDLLSKPAGTTSFKDVEYREIPGPVQSR
jgi:hypothetical protein